MGFVTEFQVLEENIAKYPTQNVGAKNHNELWVPSKDLEDFNNAIIGGIKVIKIFIGKEFNYSDDDKIEKLILKLKNHETQNTDYKR